VVEIPLRKRALEAQLSSEVRFHIDELTDANIALGVSPKKHAGERVLEFGGGEQIKEELRDVHRVPVIESAIANLKSASASSANRRRSPP